MEAAIAAGTFRSDLYYGLNVFPIEIPPQAQRGHSPAGRVLHRSFCEKSRKEHPWDKQKDSGPSSLVPMARHANYKTVVERSVIVCETENFSVDESWLSRQPLTGEPKASLDYLESLRPRRKR